jgi:hypothetical protein
MEPHQLHGIFLPVAAATGAGAAPVSPVIFRRRSGGGKDIARRPPTPGLLFLPRIYRRNFGNSLSSRYIFQI